MFRVLGRIGVLLLVAAIPMAAPAQPASPDRFTTIDYPGAVGTYLHGINSRGDIVGGWEDSDTEHGFVLRNGEFLSFDYPGADWTEAEGISPQGDIVGQYGLSDGTTHGFLLRDVDLGALVFFTIDVPGQPNTMPEKITPDGTVVGCYHVNNPNGTTNLNTMYGFVMDRNGVVTPLAMTRSMNNGINPAEDVVGIYFSPTSGLAEQSYLIHDGAMTWFHFPGSVVTQAWDISSQGTIVGFHRSSLTGPPPQFHGFVMKGSAMTSFDVPGAQQTRAFGVNASGEVVGYYKDANGFHGFLLRPLLSSLSPAGVWVGLKNSDDVGIRFDLRAEIYHNGSTLIGSGELAGVPGGSSGFNNAKLDAIPLNLPEAVAISPGDTISIKLSVRNACSGSGKNSGTARIWFNDAVANSHFATTIDGDNSSQYLLDGSALGSSPGRGPKKPIDVPVGAKCGAFQSFGTWTGALN